MKIKFVLLLILGYGFASNVAFADKAADKALESIFNEIYDEETTQSYSDALPALQKFFKEIKSQNVSYEKAYIIAFGEISEWQKIYRFDSHSKIAPQARRYVESSELYYLSNATAIYVGVVDGKVYDFFSRKADEGAPYEALEVPEYLESAFLPTGSTERLTLFAPHSVLTRYTQLESLLESPIQVIEPIIEGYDENSSSYLALKQKAAHLVPVGTYAASDYLLSKKVSYSALEKALSGDVYKEARKEQLERALEESQDRFLELKKVLNAL